MISVIIPCRNEEQHIADNIKEIESTFLKLDQAYEIIVVDDCSNDDTFLQLNNIQDINVYRKTIQQGKGSAVKTGWKIAEGDLVLVIDSDLQIKPTEIEVFLNQMEHYNADVVVGNKRHLFSNVKYPLIRRIVSLGYNSLVRFLFGLQLRDSQCGFKLFKKAVLDKIMPKILVKQFAFDLEILVALKENNIRVADAPVYVDKALGIGSVNISSIFNTAKDTLAVFYRKQTGWYR